MNKHILLGACLLSFLTTSCSKEDITENGTETPTGKTITIQANINNGNDTRMTHVDGGKEDGLKFNWSDSESFNLYQGNASTAFPFSKSTSGNTFTGTGPSEGDNNFYAVYGNNITNNGGKLTINIASQTGDVSAENGITTFMMAQTGDLTQTLQFNHKLTVLKLNLTLPAEVTEAKVNKVTLTGLHNRADYTLESGKYSYEDKYIIPIVARNGSNGFTISDSKMITAYVAVFPETIAAKQLTIKAETDKDLYYYTMATGNTLPEGKVIPVNITLTKVVHEFVDLGLPSRYKWATMNIGAISPEDCGDYFAWGETETKSNYSWDTYMCTSSQCGFEYDPLQYYTYDHSLNGTQHDVAHVKWGGKWEMPMECVVTELINNTTAEWTDKGLKLTSKVAGYTDNSIFLPAAGLYFDYLKNKDLWGCFWTATRTYVSYSQSSNIGFNTSERTFVITADERYIGHVVRPVMKEE